MDKKKSIRKNFFFARKKNFFEIKNQFFNPLKTLIKKKIGKSKFNISLYYPCNFEVNVLKILERECIKNNFKISNERVEEIIKVNSN